MNGLAAHGVSKYFGSQAALSDVSVSLVPGEVHALLGHNGAGKSTLLRLFAGVHTPEDGQLLLDGQPITYADPAGALAVGIVTVYQELRVINALTVTENVFLGRELTRRGQLDRRTMRRRTAELLAEYDIPATPETRTGALAVAHRQMLEVAAGLDRGARYLLLDEPTTALEADQIDHLMAVIRRVASTGVAVAMVNHKVDEVLSVADRITVLADGQVVLADTLDRLDRTQIIAAIVGDEESHDALAETADGPGRSSGNPVALPPRRAADSSRIRLAARGARTDSVGPVDLEIPAGQVTVLYGLVGSGRTEFVRSLIGVDQLRSGRLELDGAPYAPSGPVAAVAAGVCTVSEDRKGEGLIPQLDSRINASVTVLDTFSRLGWLSRRQMTSAADRLLKDLRLHGDSSVPIQSLSGGNQQKVMLGRALMGHPRLLVLDEPTKGVDIGAKAEIHALITRLAHQEDMAVLVVSSEEEEVLGVADRILVFVAGSCDGQVATPDAHTTQSLRRIALPNSDLASAT